MERKNGKELMGERENVNEWERENVNEWERESGKRM